VSIHIAQYFGNLFISQSNVTVHATKRGRTQPRHYGEALTEEEVLERIREQEEKKKKEKAAKKRSAKGTGKTKRGRAQGRGRQARARHEETEDENTCQVCKGHYDDDDEEAKEGWIGCDERGCWRWYHYWCVGHLDMPDPKLKWICPACKEEDDP